MRKRIKHQIHADVGEGHSSTDEAVPCTVRLLLISTLLFLTSACGSAVTGINSRSDALTQSFLATLQDFTTQDYLDEPEKVERLFGLKLAMGEWKFRKLLPFNYVSRDRESVASGPSVRFPFIDYRNVHYDESIKPDAVLTILFVPLRSESTCVPKIDVLERFGPPNDRGGFKNALQYKFGGTKGLIAVFQSDSNGCLIRVNLYRNDGNE
ncbi:hypothetical protein [Caballeronia sp. M1242]|uniref:hypothetical protein n=1 Tax=Caballeronia sp. M1242 TaxID=2814653 RepID=UPI0019CF4C53|nr:hypothetical protein [Caballeronia sp. M1242]QSN61163.1 hypothetical protein JYK05_12670 [Caballeronia sp. M1242]